MSKRERECLRRKACCFNPNIWMRGMLSSRRGEKQKNEKENEKVEISRVRER